MLDTPSGVSENLYYYNSIRHTVLLIKIKKVIIKMATLTINNKSKHVLLRLYLHTNYV